MAIKICKALKFIEKHRDEMGLSSSETDAMRDSLVEHFGSREKYDEWVFDILYRCGHFDHLKIPDV